MRARPLGAIVSQIVVAGTSLLLSLIALRQLGTAGLGTFSLLFGILLTASAVQTGWIGDSLTVLDRFDPGIRRSLFQSQYVAIVVVFSVSSWLASLLGGVEASTAVLFGVASAAWGVEETMRRILLARRQFWTLVVNDLSFSIGAIGLLVVVVATGGEITIATLVAALVAGSTIAIGVAVLQLPRIELVRGPIAASRMRDLSSFAFWRAIQVGLRPGSLAAVRVIVATTASLGAVGQLEAARLIIAPILTVVNGAAMYFLPTYALQVKRGAAFRPSVPKAMTVIAAGTLGYGVIALGAHNLNEGFLTSGEAPVSTAAIAAWVLYSTAFGIGLPAGVAAIALGRSRQTFNVRVIDAVIGVTLATVFALLGWIDAVPAGLAAGAFVGAVLLLRSLDDVPPAVAPVDTSTSDPASESPPESSDEVELEPTHWSWAPERSSPPPSVAPTTPLPPPPPTSGVRTSRPSTKSVRNVTVPTRHALTTTRERRVELQRRLLWIAPLLLIVATEYKLRRRDIDGALTGTVDLMIAAELLVVATVGVWALWRLIPSRPHVEPLMMVMWGYVLTTAVSALYSAFPMLALARAVELIVIAAVIQLVSSQGTLSTIGRFLHGWIVLISASIVAGLLYVAPTTGPQEGRFTWFSVHSVAAGSMFATSIPVLFGLWLERGRRSLPWPRWVYGSLFVVHIGFLLLTRTRGSIGGVAVAIAVMAWLSSGRRARPELILGSLIAGGAIALAFGRSVLEFLTRGETVDQIGTFNRRTEIWSLAWDSFLDHPVFGLGFNSAKGVFYDETGLGGAHNSLINVMTDVGVVGVIWWLALVIGAIVTLARLRRLERRSHVLLLGAAGTARSDHLILTGVFVALLINSITSEGLGAGVNVMAIWWFLCCAWLTLLDRNQRASSATKVSRQRQLQPAR